MTNALRAVYRYWIGLLFLAVIVQVAAAAYGAFYSADKLNAQSGSDEQKTISEEVFDHGFNVHNGLGYFIFLAAVLFFLIALGARVGRPRIWWCLAVPILVAVQIVLAWASENTHGVGILHGINALVIFGFTGSLAAVAWRTPMAREAAPAPAGAPSAPG